MAMQRRRVISAANGGKPAVEAIMANLAKENEMWRRNGEMRESDKESESADICESVISKMAKTGGAGAWHGGSIE
jgi:hypothetical protein